MPGVVVIESRPAAVPGWLGVKLRLTLQEVEGARLAGQVVVSVKSPFRVRAMGMASVPAFWMATTCGAAEMAVTATGSGKLMAAG